MRKPSALRARRHPDAMPLLICVEPRCTMWESRYERRTSESQKRKLRSPRVMIPDATDVNAWRLDHTRKVEHPDFPNEPGRPYTVFVSTRNAKFRRGCMCPWAGKGEVLFSDTTKKGVVMCSCPGAEYRHDGATYHGEYEDTCPFLRKDDLCVPGSQKKQQATP